MRKYFQQKRRVRRRRSQSRFSGCYARRLSVEDLEDRRMLAGDIEWIQQFGLNNAPTSDTVAAADADGSLYAIVRIDNQHPTGASDGEFLKKFDAAGNELWTQRLSIAPLDRALSMAVGPTGVYIAGVTGYRPPTFEEDVDIGAFVLKLDAAGNELWIHEFGTAGVDSHDWATVIAVDASDVYVAGYTQGTLPGQTTSGGRDAFVRKLDANGAEVWTRQFGTTGSDVVSGVAVDGTGVYVTGYTTGTFDGQTNAGDSDAFVRKHDLAGNETWTRQFGTVEHDLPAGVAVNTAGVFVAGSVGGQSSSGNQDGFVWTFDHIASETRVQFGSSDWDEVNGIAVDSGSVYLSGFTLGELPGQSNLGSSDGFVRKLDLDLNEIWTRQYGTSEPELATGFAPGVVRADATGIYVTGTILDASSYYDGYVRKFDFQGAEQWSLQLGMGAPANVLAEASAVDADGNVYIVGSVNGAFPGHSLAAGTTFVRKYDPGGSEVWTRQFAGADSALRISVDASAVYVTGGTQVHKYDVDGNAAWTRTLTTGGFDQVTDVAATATGIYITGFTTGAFPGHTSAGNRDVFARKYDTDGNDLWTRQFGTEQDDESVGIAVSGASVYIAGSTSGAFPGQLQLGGRDLFVRCLDADGQEAWTRQAGTEDWDFPTGVAADATGAYIVGYTGGTLPGQSSLGNQDAFVWKFQASGSDAWVRQFGTDAADFARGVAADATGVYVAGDVSGALPGQTSAGDRDGFVRKYTATGEEIWTQQFGTANGLFTSDVAAAAEGVYAAGYTTSPFLGHIQVGVHDSFVVKFAADANVELSVDPATIDDDLQTVVTNIQNIVPEEGGEPPNVVLTADTELLDAVIAAVASLAPNAGGAVVTIVVQLADGDYAGQTVDVPAGVRLVIDGSNGSVTFTGASPAFTVTSGEVVATGVTFVNATDAPTILVAGGTFVLRNSFVHETTGGSRAAIEIASGSVDLGDGDDGGGNTIAVNGAGELIRNLGAQFVPALGNLFQRDGVALVSNFEIESSVFHGLDAAGWGIVGFSPSDLFVLSDQGEVTGNELSTIENTGAFGGFGADTITLVASIGAVEFTGNGTWKWSLQVPAAAQSQPVAITAVNSDGAAVTATFQLVINAAAPAVTLSGGVLFIMGSSTANDVVAIAKDANSIRVIASFISSPLVFAQSDVIEIRVDTGGGHDIVVTTPNMIKPMILEGGDGNDLLTGGGGRNRILGGSGNDVIHGGDGDDVLLGGSGNDDLFGGLGNDVLVGGDGNDMLFGGLGRDVIIGSQDNDLLDGGTGEDILIGGYTIHDNSVSALDEIMSIWGSAIAFNSRVTTLTAAGGLLQSGVAVFDDDDGDLLLGGAGRDLIFGDANPWDGVWDLMVLQPALDALVATS